MGTSAVPSQPELNLTAAFDSIATKVVAEHPRGNPSKPVIVLALLLLSFFITEGFIPLRTAVQIGADEGFELAKATLCLKGHHLYTEVWNDQPPLHTFLITQIIKYISPSILGPRLLTIGFSALLLCAIFGIVLRIHGLLVASITTCLVIASPGFLELSSSCMLEIPALAVALAAMAWPLFCRQTKGFTGEIACGALFGLGLQIKLVPSIYLALMAFLIFLRYRQSPRPFWSIAVSLSVLGACLVCVYVGIDLLIERGAYLTHFQQAWASHFSPAKSPEYGSAADHPFEWNILLKNWDTTVPAFVGLAILLARVSFCRALFPLVWLALTFLVFGVHKPWWPYYYIHTAIPMCWCAAVAAAFLWGRLKRRMVLAGISTLAVLCILGWMGARIYLQVANLRQAPRTFSSPVIAQMERFRPFTQWLFADQLVYSFHSGIPMVPSLAVVPIKRMWSGEMTNAKMREELAKYRPGLILLLNDGRPAPFSDLLQADYQLVYMDKDNRLYADRAIAKKPRRSFGD